MLLPLAVLVLLAPGCGGLPPDVVRARALFEQRDYQQAAVLARQALARGGPPGHPEAWRIAVQSEVNLGAMDQALADYQQMYTAYRDHDRVLLRRLALTILWQGLRVPSVQVRVRAIQSVERREQEQLARNVDALMTDEDDPVAAAAAVALLRSSPGAPDIAAQLLASDDAWARAIAVEGIGRKVGLRARPDLVFALADGDARVRGAGASALAAMKQAEDTVTLGRLATEDPDPAVRVVALAGLARGKRGDTPRAIALGALDAPEPAVQLAGLRLLADLGERAVLDGVARDPKRHRDAPGIALVAHLLAARLAGSEVDAGASWQRAVAHGSWARSWDLRAAAADALVPGKKQRTVAPDQAVALLTPLLSDDSGRVRVAAGLALARMLHPPGLAMLSGSCLDPDPLAAEDALRAHVEIELVSMGLLSSLLGESVLVRILAADAILGVLD